jgi:Family of unknown function (DUF6088)
MRKDFTSPVAAGHIMASIRERIERGGERLWQYGDFRDLPFTAVAQALSRLQRAGSVERLSKGVYYRTRDTAFGKSRPNPTAIRNLALKDRTIFPAGIAAANLLGFTTQTAKGDEVATNSPSLPRKLVGTETIIHTRRPQAWAGLSGEDAALLDFLRSGGRTSELGPAETVNRALGLLSEKGRYQRLLNVTDSEPPRVRAILGAIGEQLSESEMLLERLRKSLNPLSRFDFGLLSGLRHANKWQAKDFRPHETV